MSPIMQRNPVVLLRRSKESAPKSDSTVEGISQLRCCEDPNRNPARNPVTRKTDYARAQKIYDRLHGCISGCEVRLGFQERRCSCWSRRFFRRRARTRRSTPSLRRCSENTGRQESLPKPNFRNSKRWSIRPDSSATRRRAFRAHAG